MEEIKKKSKLEQASIVLAVLLTFAVLARQFESISFVGLLWLAALGFLCYLLLRGGKEKLFGWAFTAIAAVGLIAFFSGYSWGWYQPNWTHSQVRFFCLLPGLLMLLGWLGVASLGAMLYAGKFPAFGDVLRKYWYVPALAFAVAFAVTLLVGFVLAVMGPHYWPGFEEFASLRTLLWAGFALCLGLRAAGYEELPSRAVGGSAETVKYTSPALLLFLTVITLGIWMLVWIWKTTAALAPYEDKHPRKPWLETLLCLLLPFYMVYWFYTTAQLSAVAADGEKDRHFTTLILVMSCLLTPIAMLLLQDKLNVLADREEEIEVELVETETVEAEPVEEAPVEQEDPVSVEEEPAPVEQDAPIAVEDEPDPEE